MDKIPEDRLVVDALQLKKDMFTSRFVRHKSPAEWSTMDNWYFKHICDVLNHARIIFTADVDTLVNKKPQMKSE